MNAEPVDTEWLRRQVVDVVRLQEAIGYGEKVVSCMVDGRELLLRAPTLAAVADLLWRRLRPYRPDVIAGMTLSADTLVAAVLLAAAADGVPVTGAIVRKQRKRYGLQKLIEGPRIPAGARVAIVDDLLNYGRTATRCVSAFRTVGARIVAFGVLLDYGRPSTRRLMAGHRIGIEALFSMSDVGLAPRLPDRSWQLAPRWSATLPADPGRSSARSTVERVYTCSSGWLTAHTTDGGHAWRRDLGAGDWRLHATAPEALLLTRTDADDDTATVLRLDARDGSPDWQQTLPGTVAAIGLQEHRKLAIVAGSAGPVGLNIVDGAIVWQHDQPAAEGLAVGEDRFAIRTGGKLLIGSTVTGRITTERWIGADHGRLVAANPHSFVTPVHRHGLLCVDHNGASRWIATLPAGRVTALAWTGRHWAAATSTGTLWLLDDQRGTPITSHPTGAPADDIVTLDDRTLAWLADGHLCAIALEPTTRRLAPPRSIGGP